MKAVNPATQAYFNPAHYAGQLAELIARRQEKADSNWWQSVLIELHDQLAERFLPDDESGGRFLTKLETRIAAKPVAREIPGSCAPWRKAGAPRAAAETPDIFKQPGMESSRFDLLEFRHNGFEARLQELETNAERSLACNTDILRMHEKDLQECATQNCLDGINSGLQAQIDRLTARLAALESNQSRNPA